MSEKTIKLYDENAYANEFEAKVLSCEAVDEGEDCYRLILDRTLFFPEEGGQTPDKGYLRVLGDSETDVQPEEGPAPDGWIKVTDVQIKGDVIRHYVNSPIEVGCRVKGTIDFEHRFSNMQQHSGEHIFSGIVNSKFGYDNVGFHLSDSVVTMDYSGQLSEDDLSLVEKLVNRAIYENVEIEAGYPSAEELDKMNYRSKKELTGDVRIVTIPGYDVCACCAPHVRRTGEIGILKVISSQNYKGGTRVSILCGKRALLFLMDEHSMISSLANSLSTSREKIPEQFEKQQSDIYELKKKLREAGEKLLKAQMEKIPADIEHACLFADADSDQGVIRRCVNDMTSIRDGFCAVFWGDADSGYRFIIGCSSGRDCNDILSDLKDNFKVRGGGAPAMVQGSLSGATEDEILSIFRRYNNIESMGTMLND